MKNKLIISVDVEALPKRSSIDPLERLIYGKFPEHSREFGIPYILNLADKFNFIISCFVDYAEYGYYGKEFLQIPKYIKDRNHDVQLHLHAGAVSNEVWPKNLTPCKSLFYANEEQSDFLIDYIL